MNKKWIIFSLLFVALLASIVLGGWALVRWHYQSLMFERLMCLRGIHDWMIWDADVARVGVEGYIDGEYEQLEYYLSHPARLNPDLPNSITHQNTEPTFCASLRPSLWLPEVREERSDFRQKIGVTNDAEFLKRSSAVWRHAKEKKTGSFRISVGD